MTKPKESKIKDPELKGKWIAALRSGDYEQGRGALKTLSYMSDNDDLDNDYIAGPLQCAHCCLGVLLEILAPEGFVSAPPYAVGYTHTFPGTSSKQEVYPNKLKMRELGIHTATMNHLAELNDQERLNFAQIADYIEEHL